MVDNTPDSPSPKKKIAIACQGGGSHAAFTAGVLETILENKNDRFDLVGFSGVSGGAICAILAWYGLVTSGEKRAVELLNAFWEDNSARSPWDAYLNKSLMVLAKLRDLYAMPDFNPYLWINYGQEKIKEMLENRIDFNTIGDLVKDPVPMLRIGAVNILTGEFVVFTEKTISIEAVLASTALPTIFKAVQIWEDFYWDAMFSQNPPIKEFTKNIDVEDKPDEIWIIQLNQTKRRKKPITPHDIMERRNELAGTLSIQQEIHFIETINKIIRMDPEQKTGIGKEYKIITPKIIEMKLDVAYTSRLDRTPIFMRKLKKHGKDKARMFMIDNGYL